MSTPALDAPPAEGSQEFSSLRRLLDEQTEHLDALVSRLEALQGREAEMRALLVEAHQELVRRDDAVAGLRSQVSHLQDQLAELNRVIEARDEGIAWLRGELEIHQRMVEDRDKGIAWLRDRLRDDRPLLALWDEHLRSVGAVGFARGQVGRAKRFLTGQVGSLRRGNG